MRGIHVPWQTLTTAWRNWAGNHRAIAAAVARPTSTDEVADVVRRAAAAGRTVKPVGTGHSFTAAAATTGVRLELDGLTGLVSVDPAQRLVTVRGGTPLSSLNATLAQHCALLGGGASAPT